MGQTDKLPLKPPTLSPTGKRPKNAGVAPLWISTIAALLFGALYAILPEWITVGPSWILLVIELIIILPGTIAYWLNHPFSIRTNRILAFVLLGIITVSLISGIVLLVVTLPQRQQGIQAIGLLRTGTLLYLCNILVFALWYWEIDGDGPHKRFQAGHQASDFLFPQQIDGNSWGWAPHFVDYLFLAFTGATALSPTDTYPLTRPAKCLMMIEAIIAMTILTILIGRAINIV
ncbi:hypothetical protein [Dictyobacter arantiisoli]|nr:hypothetical protein [Dictyobacter arantiisoli]